MKQELQHAGVPAPGALRRRPQGWAGAVWQSGRRPTSKLPLNSHRTTTCLHQWRLTQPEHSSQKWPSISVNNTLCVAFFFFGSSPHWCDFILNVRCMAQLVIKLWVIIPSSIKRLWCVDGWSTHISESAGFKRCLCDKEEGNLKQRGFNGWIDVASFLDMAAFCCLSLVPQRKCQVSSPLWIMNLVVTNWKCLSCIVCRRLLAWLCDVGWPLREAAVWCPGSALSQAGCD